MTNKKNKKNIIFLLPLLPLILCISNSNILNVHADSYNYDFSNINEENSIEFVIKHNIDIPDKIKNSSDLGKITSNIIKTSVNKHDYVFTYNYDKMQEYADSIKEVVKSYSNTETLSIQSSYSLKYNTVKDSNGNWVTSGGAYDARWLNYNCYAFSIHRNEPSPFYSTGKQYQPGDMSETGSFSTSNTILDLASIVKNDLEAMGYSNVSLTTTIPTITDEQELICVRMCTSDYHFMRYDLTTNAWYHKPGLTAVLKYNYTPNNDMLWYGESSYYGEESPNSLIYDSDIYFIKYDKNKISVSSSTSNLSYKLNINTNKDSILEIDNSSYEKFYKFNISSSNSLNIELYNNEMVLLENYVGSNIIFYTSLSSEIYYLKFNYQDDNHSGIANINVSAHSHSYTYEEASSGHTATCTICEYTTTLGHVFDQHYCIYCNAYTSTHDYDSKYTWVNYTLHSAQCSCGAIAKQGHAVSSGSFSSGKQYVPCLLCGGLAKVGFIQTKNSSSISYVTTNGSFILPNNIIVLVDEDIEAYLNGTLVFYTKTNLPIVY